MYGLKHSYTHSGSTDSAAVVFPDILASLCFSAKGSGDPSAITHIFHVVLDSVLLQVGRRLCSVEPLGRVHVRLLKVVPVDLQLVVRVGTQVHCSEGKHVSSPRSTHIRKRECAWAEICLIPHNELDGVDFQPPGMFFFVSCSQSICSTLFHTLTTAVWKP